MLWRGPGRAVGRAVFISIIAEKSAVYNKISGSTRAAGGNSTDNGRYKTMRKMKGNAGRITAAPRAQRENSPAVWQHIKGIGIIYCKTKTGKGKRLCIFLLYFYIKDNKNNK